MVFNSLGSNYNYDFVLKSLFASNNKLNKLALVNYLNTKYSGETVLLYKCREAIKLALELLKLPKGTKIGITGFTCYVVYKAVVDAGYSPIYLDIEESTLNFSLDEIKRHKDLKVLIIQNTLGRPCDIVKIKDYCLENNVILIEDLAHSIGSIYKSGKETGFYGDFVVLSFGQDKVVDAVSGGALIIKNNEYKDLINNISFKKISFNKQVKDKFYPLFTFLIRKTYNFGIGKIFHLFLKKINVLPRPVENTKPIQLHDLPNWYCGMINYQFSNLEKNLMHRKQIANIYQVKLSKSLAGFSLRSPVIVDDRKDLIQNLQGYGIHISDIWYDAPIAPQRFLKLTNYSLGRCLVSEDVSQKIINLPTHINISTTDALKISDKINIWLNTQQK